MTDSLEYLLDTDICIYLLNGNEHIKSRISLAGIETISISILTVSELYYGAFNSTQVDKNLGRIEAFLSSPGLQILHINKRAAQSFGKIKASLRSKGKLISDVDILIASVALSYNLKVVTNNTAHFARIPELSLINWL